MHEIQQVAGLEIHLNWPEIPEDIQQTALDMWRDYNALPPGINPEDRAKQAVALAKDLETGRPLAIATVQREHMDWVGCEMFVYRNFSVADTRLRNNTVELITATFDFLSRLEDNPAAGLYMEIENRAVMQNKNDAIWLETRFAYIGKTPEGWHKRVRFFPHACLSKGDLQ